MARSASGFRWQYDRVTPNLQQAPARAKAYLSRVTTFHALKAETYMKTMAPWTDRSSNARGSLSAVADNSGGRNYHYEIILSHGMDYGIWLEIRFAGRNAIIRPTIRHQAPEYFADCGMIMNRMFGDGS